MQDRGYRRELERLQVTCPRSNDGWSGYFKDLSVKILSYNDFVLSKYIYILGTPT